MKSFSPCCKSAVAGGEPEAGFWPAALFPEACASTSVAAVKHKRASSDFVRRVGFSPYEATIKVRPNAN